MFFCLRVNRLVSSRACPHHLRDSRACVCVCVRAFRWVEIASTHAVYQNIPTTAHPHIVVVVFVAQELRVGTNPFASALDEEWDVSLMFSVCSFEWLLQPF